MAGGIVEDELQQVSGRARPPLRRRASLLILSALACAACAPSAAHAQGAVTLCHATGNPAAPYEQITVSGAELELHVQHPEDIVPAPPGGCPAIAEPPDPQPGLPALPGADDEEDAVPTPEPRRRRRTRSRSRSRVSPAASTAPAAATPMPRMSGLPLTGRRDDLLALCGLGLLMAGAGLRLVVVRSR